MCGNLECRNKNSRRSCPHPPNQALHPACSSGCVAWGGQEGVSPRFSEVIAMLEDIHGLLGRWPFDPDRLNARLIEAEDGRNIIQVRVELGILQMEMSGRPDGGPDVLAAVERRLASEPDLSIDAGLAADLRAEAVQVHQRYVARLALEDYAGVVEDTRRNLRVFDLCRDHAEAPEDRRVLERFRAQVVATRARAAALEAIRGQSAADARGVLAEAVEEIRRGIVDGAADPPEVAMLEGMRDVLQPKLPVSQRHELERRLASALTSENYELAAILRDELRQL